MIAEVTIRPMTAADVECVTALDRVCTPVPWSASTFHAQLVTPTACYLVATRDGVILGYLGGQICDDEGHLTTLGVDPGHRRQGIGDRLVAHFVSKSLRRGCRRLTLEVREGNLGAQRLYRRWGFLPLSRRKRYYSDNDEDALVMWVEDTAGGDFRALHTEMTRRLCARGFIADSPGQ